MPSGPRAPDSTYVCGNDCGEPFGGQGSVTSWAIPTTPIPGLETLSSGVLTGEPIAEAAGSRQVRVTVYDSCPQGPQKVDQTSTIVIEE